ncbi:MAG TPA: Kdo hydroxylase family protein, partial [Verrucomicrobiae bacterium]|nr:Kdo hydroxylase family protein [Verrucomicrobiae bacterium]
PTGSQDHFSETSWDGSKWCCTCLEENQVLLFEGLPYEFPEEDRLFLISHRLGEARFHKNISYRPEQDVVRGFTSADPETSRRMHEVMRRYSENVVQFLSRILAPYAGHWKLDYASFRPEAEQDRKLPLHKRNDLLHTDAFPSRPTRGGRILRCFTNLNPAEARIWQTTDPFPVLAMNHAAGAGLTDFARDGNSMFSTAIRGIKTAIGLAPKAQSRYDRFMLRFHDYLKENSDFQRTCRKVSLEFPPGSTWICFTDSVPHAVLRGQYAVEQTLIVPPEALVAPERSPLRILEKLAGAPLVP